DPSKIVVIRNGVDLTRFTTAPEEGRIRRDLGIADSAQLFAVVSRLTEMKGLEQFLEAAAALKPRYPDARFLIVGETAPHNLGYLPKLQALAERLGITDRVIFAGIRSDVPALLSSVNVSVMPSLNEALSNVLLESMAAGAPTVGTRGGGPRGGAVR